MNNTLFSLPEGADLSPLNLAADGALGEGLAVGLGIQGLGGLASSSLLFPPCFPAFVPFLLPRDLHDFGVGSVEVYLLKYA